MDTLGSRVKTLRKQRKLSLEELAGRVGSTKGHLSMIERDRINVSAETACKLAGDLGVTAQWLVAGGSIENARDEVFRLKYMALTPDERSRFRAVVAAWAGGLP